MHLIILLIDETEEVTDIKGKAIVGENVEVIYSTFDELPEHHKRVSEMVIELPRPCGARKGCHDPAGQYHETGKSLQPTFRQTDVRYPEVLTRQRCTCRSAFSAVRTRNMREGGSLTILATALVDTGSKMDDVVFEEFKGTGNMEAVLDRKLSEKRVFPAIDIVKSGTRRDDLLLEPEEQEAVEIMRKAINGMRTDEAVENILNMFARTRNNQEYIHMVKKNRIV